MDNPRSLDELGTEWEVTPAELQGLWRQNPEIAVVDCREPYELAEASLPGAIAIPMNEIPDRIGELDAQRDTVIVCHHGVRSLRVASWLRRQAGFGHVKSLRGGIDAWALEIDPATGRY